MCQNESASGKGFKLTVTCLLSTSRFSWAFFTRPFIIEGSVTSLLALNSCFVFSSAYSLKGELNFSSSFRQENTCAALHVNMSHSTRKPVLWTELRIVLQYNMRVINNYFFLKKMMWKPGHPGVRTARYAPVCFNSCKYKLFCNCIF